MQLGMGRFLLAKDFNALVPATDVDVDVEDTPDMDSNSNNSKFLKHQTLLRLLTLRNWMFDVVADLTSTTTTTTDNANHKWGTCISRFPAAVLEHTNSAVPQRKRRWSSLHIDILPLLAPAVECKRLQRRITLQFTPTSPGFSVRSLWSAGTLSMLYA